MLFVLWQVALSTCKMTSSTNLFSTDAIRKAFFYIDPTFQGKDSLWNITFIQSSFIIASLSPIVTFSSVKVFVCFCVQRSHFIQLLFYNSVTNIESFFHQIFGNGFSIFKTKSRNCPVPKLLSHWPQYPSTLLLLSNEEDAVAEMESPGPGFSHSLEQHILHFDL